ncbi:hypothetical protein Mal4_36790 [Maioricimonas rarisocia]|uniref:HEAT repeat protein n=1 Tax=Maioricimonas rarisocia TaxID=2528026 RepID=A0A517ZA24_9PLAN|nr:hypothetical protein [Maioricimonas rarisocia]QDU39338.1 hypothetical protein Mal4_36790 [Maioricimonas rarisocia]
MTQLTQDDVRATEPELYLRARVTGAIFLLIGIVSGLAILSSRDPIAFKMGLSVLLVWPFLITGAVFLAFTDFFVSQSVQLRNRKAPSKKLLGALTPDEHVVLFCPESEVVLTNSRIFLEGTQLHGIVRIRSVASVYARGRQVTLRTAHHRHDRAMRTKRESRELVKGVRALARLPRGPIELSKAAAAAIDAYDFRFGRLKVDDSGVDLFDTIGEAGRFATAAVAGGGVIGAALAAGDIDREPLSRSSKAKRNATIYLRRSGYTTAKESESDLDQIMNRLANANVAGLMGQFAESTDDTVRGACVAALRDLGPAAEPALPMIRRILDDRDSKLRPLAHQALQSIMDRPRSDPTGGGFKR